MKRSTMVLALVGLLAAAVGAGVSSAAPVQVTCSDMTHCDASVIADESVCPPNFGCSSGGASARGSVEGVPGIDRSGGVALSHGGSVHLAGPASSAGLSASGSVCQVPTAWYPEYHNVSCVFKYSGDPARIHIEGSAVATPPESYVRVWVLSENGAHVAECYDYNDGLAQCGGSFVPSVSLYPGARLVCVGTIQYFGSIRCASY